MDNEVEFISCCLLDNEIINKAISAGIQPAWFSNRLNQQVWVEMVKRIGQGKTVDIIWADDFVRTVTRNGELIFTNATHNVLNPKSEALSAIEIMRRDYLRRQVSSILNNAHRKLNVAEPDILIDEINEQLTRVKHNNADKLNEDIEKKIIEQLNRGIECTTGFPQLDFLVKGIELGVLWIVGGYTSNGKTTFVLNLSYNLANNSHPVTFFSTEMSKILLTKRIATMISGVNPSIATSLTEGQKEAYKYGVHYAMDLPIEMYNTLSLPEIRMIVQQKKSKLYIVDYIQMIDPGIKIENEVRGLGYIVREMERLTKEYEICIIATSQFHRTKENAPTLSSYRGSGEIEENTDIGILLYYPYQQATFEEQRKIKEVGKDNIINIAVQKNRIHGLTGIIKFTFDRQTLRFKEVDCEVKS